ncbi:cyclin-dependent protein kinase [Elasticomyces elasticus]|nr:cyclin-dependent protein kinase [Elasticomyces elasticus]
MGGPPSAAASVRNAASVPMPLPVPAVQNLKRSAQAAFDEAPESSKTLGYATQKHITDRYKVLGFISSGTYGRVYKACNRDVQGKDHVPKTRDGRTIELFAIKKFKPDKEGEVQYTGISQSAIREMALCTELSHNNVISLVEIILESKCIFMVFEYAEHDLLQIIHFHTTQTPRSPIPAPTVRSILLQLLTGLLYLHQNWVIHRDLKPANIMVTSAGSVKIGDLGLARLFYNPLHALFTGDKVVVTIWYRAPELLLGSRHYTPAIDLWAVGCIFAELLSLRPIFKGEEAKQEGKKSMPFQRHQMGKICEVLGVPKREQWPLITAMPEYNQLSTLAAGNPKVQRPQGLENWYRTIMNANQYAGNAIPQSPGPEGLDLLKCLLEWDPLKRTTAEKALQHPYFKKLGVAKVSDNCFEGASLKYPSRKVSSEDNSIGTASLPGTKRGGLPDDRPLKRIKDG